MLQKGFSLPLLAIIASLTLIGSALIIKTGLIQSLPLANNLPFIPKPTPAPEQTLCTQDAKLCSDGSYVGRSGPKCEFTPCPSASNTNSWKTYNNKRVGFEIKYPARYETPYYPKPEGQGSSVDAEGNEDNTTVILGDTFSGVITLILFPYEKSLADLIKDPFKKAPYSDYHVLFEKIKDLEVSGTTISWYLTEDKNDNTKGYSAFWIGKNHAFIVKTSAEFDKQELEQVLSSFKFIP